MDYEILQSKEQYCGPIFKVYSDMVQMPDGKPALREYIERGSASAVVPITAEGDILFVYQYRHPYRQKLLEIPAGMIEPGEDPLHCVSRELEEETGFYSEHIVPFTSVYPSPGFCAETLHLYFATQLKKGQQHFDPDEFIELKKYSLAESLAMIASGEIRDGKTIMGILGYQCFKHHEQ